MFVVLFEVQPKKHEWERYLDLAKLLRPELYGIRGFIDNERYESERREGRILSLSTWANEKALIRWRAHALHHEVQEQGRFEVFEGYHLRVGEVVSDTHVPEGHALLEQRFDETETGQAKAATVSELPPGSEIHLEGLRRGAVGLVDLEAFSSLYTPGKCLLLASWRDADVASTWLGKVAGEDIRHRQVRIIRDYGMTDRVEAPQYYPAVTN